MVEFANDQHGSRFIQTRLETCSKEIRNLIFKEITPSTIELMTDVFGNYVIQKAFDLGDDQQKKLMVKQMEGQVLALSMHMYGCRVSRLAGLHRYTSADSENVQVIQKALEHVNTETRQKLVTELEPHIKDCVTSSNANHVIQVS
jgi:mRNA-binding protein PUF3